jgi:glutaredoxin
MLKNWLDKQGLPYTSKITDESDEAMMEFMSLNDGMISVPFTVIDTDDGRQEKLTGFDHAKFKEILGVQ